MSWIKNSNLWQILEHNVVPMDKDKRCLETNGWKMSLMKDYYIRSMFIFHAEEQLGPDVKLLHENYQSIAGV